jgi:putative transposase
MARRKIYDRDRHAHFVTFSCYRRRRLLDDDRAKRIVLGTLSPQLLRLEGRCAGFVVMPNQVHVIVWLALPGQLSELMKQWKRTSSLRIRRLFSRTLTK